MISIYSKNSVHKRLNYQTAQLWENMVSPLCGILTNIFVYHRQSYDPKGIAIGGELANVSRFKGLTRAINYHIGGMGMSREEAMIKCLAESYERYIPVMFDPKLYLKCHFDSYIGLKEKKGSDIIITSDLFEYFSDEQHEQKQFFQKFSINNPMEWVQTLEITTNKYMWVPTHLLFFGYLPKKELGEFRINSAVSTGTAVHNNVPACLLNSFYEMVLIDAAICHWYTDSRAYKIELNTRTRHLKQIINKSIPLNNINLEFYWLPSVDFPTFNIACISRGDTIPKFSIGLGCDFNLERAMYKAFIEYIGTRFLSNTLAVIQEKNIEPNSIRNFDDNVLYYALGNGADRINMKFNPAITIQDDDLPADIEGNKKHLVNLLVETCRKTNKYISFINLTNNESKDVGLVATKLWSPQLIGVPTPHAVPIKHQRFVDYGGVSHLDPHPYP